LNRKKTMAATTSEIVLLNAVTVLIGSRMLRESGAGASHRVLAVYQPPHR
jgi:hypothetical protein